MRISRLDLDGLGSPRALAERIHQIEQELPHAVPVEELCRALDILAIEEIATAGFEAALVMAVNKAAGGILLATGRSRQRQRYSIAHELGHFLIPTHMPDGSEGFTCSLDDLHRLDTRERDRRRRVEAEANGFAAALLMPQRRIRSACHGRTPNLAKIVGLARDFDVSKEAMARAYVDAHREAVAILVLQHGQIQRIYRNPNVFPWIAPHPGQAVPGRSSAGESGPAAGELSAIEECEADVWLNDRDARRVDVLTEQVLGQRDGYAMLLLHAQMADEDHDRPRRSWR